MPSGNTYLCLKRHAGGIASRHMLKLFFYSFLFLILVKVSKVDYGLFRASRSHNPAHNSCSMGPLPHYALIVGRVNTPFSHCKQACVGDGLLTL